MKKLLIALLLPLVLIGCSKVPAGHVGVKVYLLGTSKGVDVEELGVGRYWIGWNEELYLFPTFTQNYCWTAGKDDACGSADNESVTFQTEEGLSVNADLGITYSLDPTKISFIFQKYRKGVQEITDMYLRNMVRDALVYEGSNRPVEDVYGSGKGKLLEAVEARVRAQVEPIGIRLERIYFIGDIRLPPKVIEALNAKIEATQRAQQRQNEVAQAKAEADKVIESARGAAESVLIAAQKQAEANRVLNASITEQLIQYKKLENEKFAIDRWSGTVPQYVGGGSPVPFVNVTQDKK